MRYLLTILFSFWFLISNCQLPACKNPLITIPVSDTVTLPNNNITLSPIATTYNGEGVSSWTWHSINGNGSTKDSITQNITITGLVQGFSDWSVTCLDSCGASATVNIIITVLPLPTGLFVVTATANPSVLQLPSNTSTIQLSGNFKFSSWIQETTGGQQIDYSNQADSICTISDLVSGTYTIGYSCTTTATNPSQTVTGIVLVTVNPQYVLTLIPNPARTSVVATLTGGTTGSLVFDLYNSSGKLLQQETTTKTSNTASVTFNIGSLRNGTYPISAILSGIKVATAKLIKQ
jgi:hypothetical protein